MSLNCEEHNDLPMVTEGRSNPLGGGVKKKNDKRRVKLLSVAVYAASELHIEHDLSSRSKFSVAVQTP